MNILVTGSHGLVGSALVPALERDGHRVIRAVRRPARSDGEAAWDPPSGALEFEGALEAVVHLAGVSLATASWKGRWTSERKRAIEQSRVGPTQALCERLARRGAPPRVLVAASAIGYYGDRGDSILDETSSRGSGFLPEVADRWERACEPARRAGIRVVNVRFGLVLARSGGALAKMLLPFRLGLGGSLGSGRQYWSWVARPDVVGAIQEALDDDRLSGPVNVVAPEPIRQREFARVLGRVLRRPAFLPAPAFALRLALGEMADALLLCSARVQPERLRARGFRWLHPDLEGALRHCLHGPEVDDAERRP